MTKLLTAMAGLVALTSSASAIAPIQETKTEIAPQVSSKVYKYTELSERKYMKRLQYLNFTIGSINLTTLGIDSIFEFHKYDTVTIPGLRISFLDQSPQIVGQTLYCWKLDVGDNGGWSRTYDKTINGVECMIDSYTKLWYDGSTFRITFYYRIQCYKMFTETGGNVYYTTGTEVRFNA